MAELQISLPEELVHDVKQLGLLQPETITSILREELRRLAREPMMQERI